VTKSGSSKLRLVIVGLIVAVATLTAYLTMAQRLADPDQFFHIATGRWIIENRAIPTHDVFSWWAIANNRSWAAHEWLYGVLIYGMWALGGFAAVYWFTAALEGAAVAVAYALTRARGVSPLWSLLITVTVAFGTMYWMAPRPQVITFVLLPLTALLLQKGKWPWALALVVVGVNLHGGVWPLYVLVFALYEFPKRWWLVAAAVAVTLMNPNPIGTFLFAFGGFTNPRADQIAEFVPTVLWQRKGDLAVLVAMVVLSRMRRIPWKDGLFALAFSVLSLSAVRHLQWLYVLVLPTLAPYVTHTDWHGVSERLARWIPERFRAVFSAERTPMAVETEGGGRTSEERPTGRRTVSGILLLEIVLASALVVAVVLLSASVSRQRLDVDRWYPADMVPYLKLHKAKRVFNIWLHGGYLIFKGIQPLIDGRGDPYLSQAPGQVNLMDDYLAAIRFERDPREFMREMNVDYALVDYSALYLLLLEDPRFEVVKQDTYHVLFRFYPDRDPDPASSSLATPSVAATGAPLADTATETTTAPLADWLRNAVKNALPTAP
jgi:hypothetical protein